MKKLSLLLFLFVATNAFSQGVSLGISGGYLTELDGFGGSADVIYNINEKFAVATNATFAAADEKNFRNKWFIVDLNGHYKVIEEFYLLAGGEYLNVTIKDLGLGGGGIGPGGEQSGDEFGVNVGAGYKYNILDNVNVVAEAKYVILDVSYFHARLGLQFDL